MQDDVFLDFINTSTTRGGATYNLKTQNASKMAQDILAKSKYKALAPKQHIRGNIKQAYYNNKDFAQKLQDVLQELNITLIA